MTGPRRRSGYLQYLPGVLWDGAHGAGAPGDGFSVDDVLRVAEKILSGIDDGEHVLHGVAGAAHTHDGIEAVLDRLPQLFDPHRAPRRFLPWLGGWVGVDPAAPWDLPAQRRAIAGMVSALGRRGLHEGLRGHLDAYAVSAVRPRITLDDGVRLLFTTPTPGGVAAVHVLLSHGPYLRPDDTAAYPGVVDPGCIAALPDGDLLVGDEGLPGNLPVVPDGIWRISRAGTYLDTRGAPPRPFPLGSTGGRLNRPRALAVSGAAGSWQAHVVDRSALHRITSAAPETLTTRATLGDLGLAEGDVDAMVADGSGNLIVVDQGAIVEIDPAPQVPDVVARRPLTTSGIVPGPLARLGDHLVVADLRTQEPDGDDTRPADLVLVDRSDPDAWDEHRLLADLPTNPLVTPVALAADGSAALLVLDLGLRPLDDTAGDPFHKVMAEPAALYRVRLAPGTDRPFVAVGIDRVSELGRFTRPTGMAVVDGTVYVSDPGHKFGEADNARIRHAPGHVAVQVHFSLQRPADVRTRRTIAHHVASIVDLHKPAAVLAAPPHVPTDTEERGQSNA